jgi:hypothetical protein
LRAHSLFETISSFLPKVAFSALEELSLPSWHEPNTRLSAEQVQEARAAHPWEMLTVEPTPLPLAQRIAHPRAAKAVLHVAKRTRAKPRRWSA